MVSFREVTLKSTQISVQLISIVVAFQVFFVNQQTFFLSFLIFLIQFYYILLYLFRFSIAQPNFILQVFDHLTRCDSWRFNKFLLGWTCWLYQIIVEYQHTLLCEQIVVFRLFTAPKLCWWLASLFVFHLINLRLFQLSNFGKF